MSGTENWRVEDYARDAADFTPAELRDYAARYERNGGAEGAAIAKRFREMANAKESGK